MHWVEADLGAYVPAVQFTGELALFVQLFPAGHGVQAVEPDEVV